MVFVMGDVEEEYMIDLDKSTDAFVIKSEAKNGGSEVILIYSSSSGQKDQVLFYRHFRDNENDLFSLYNKAQEISALINKN